MSAPEPIATGTLAKTALAHLLVYLEQKKLSGTLAIWPDDAETNGAQKPDRILMLKGVPVAASLCATVSTLREGLLQLFNRKSAPYAFYGTNLLGDDRLSARIEPFSLIAESLRTTAREDLVRDIVQRLGKGPLTIPATIELARYELQPEELVLVNALRATPTPIDRVLSTLATSSGLSPVRAQRLIYLFAITKAVEAMPAPQAAPPVASSKAAAPPAEQSDAEAMEPEADDAEAMAEASDAEAEAEPAAPTQTDAPHEPMHGELDRLQNIPQPPDGLDEELRRRWLRIVTKGRLIENQNYFEMLEIEKDVKSPEARAKYFQLAKEWHPDRLPQELAPLREYVQIIFSYMSEANNTLGDEVQRTKYVQTVREGGGTPATERLMQAILDTAMEYERVLVMARRHQYDEAIALLLKILSVVKEDPEYHAMYASLLNQKHGQQASEAVLREMLESVDRAIGLYDRHEKGNLLKAQILRRLGRKSEAMTLFRKVAEINPRNIEAVREVRVARMRANSAPVDSKGKRVSEDPKQKSLFGRLFKKE